MTTAECLSVLDCLRLDGCVAVVGCVKMKLSSHVQGDEDGELGSLAMGRWRQRYGGGG